MAHMREKPRRAPKASGDVPAGTRLIRKYGNRRLYDTVASRYVTLEDLVDVFGGEEEVQVVDAVSGEDLTKRVLAQAILFEEQRRHVQIIPIELLRTLLRSRGSELDQRKIVKSLTDLTKSKARGAAAGGGAPEEIDELRRRLKALETQIRRR
jgi:polyhydroxyalkanoate synthesis repressor PhaR